MLVGGVAAVGPVVVMVHGLGGSSNSFQPLMPGLAGFRVIRPDLPGAARSALRPGRPGLMALCQALHDLIRACGVTAAHLVGHSMGTLLCQYLAAAEPKPVDRTSVVEGTRGSVRVDIGGRWWIKNKKNRKTNKHN